jgi:hypothetical protein
MRDPSGRNESKKYVWGQWRLGGRDLNARIVYHGDDHIQEQLVKAYPVVYSNKAQVL